MDEKNQSETLNPPTTSLKVATWNMDHWKRSVQQRRDGWEYLQTNQLADVVLLQECVVPAHIPVTRYRYREIGGSRAWGSAVALFNETYQIEGIDTVRSRYSSWKFSTLGTYPGSVTVSLVSLPEIGNITFISVYGLIEVYAQTTMLRIVADLIPLFDSPHGRRVILGGDFNVTTATNPRTPEYARYKAILGAVESLGLVNVASTAAERDSMIDGCLCGEDECLHLHTYGDAPGTQLDWLYATPELARRCRSVKVMRDAVTHRQLSDHAPIVAEFGIPAGDPDVPWEPSTFAREIGIRHGDTAQLIIEEIIAWALRKQEMLNRTGWRINLDRFPISEGRDPEMWIQLDIKRPERIQYTFSIKANGHVVTQFQYMSAPFDAEEERELLWSSISALPDITLDKRLSGRPSFPLILLESSAVREQFLAIMEEIIERSIEYS